MTAQGLVDCPTQLTLITLIPRQIPVRNTKEHSRVICYSRSPVERGSSPARPPEVCPGPGQAEEGGIFILKINSSSTLFCHYFLLSLCLFMCMFVPPAVTLFLVFLFISLCICHCTMRLPMSIDISEVFKCKHSFHAHFK